MKRRSRGYARQGKSRRGYFNLEHLLLFATHDSKAAKPTPPSSSHLQKGWDGLPGSPLRIRQPHLTEPKPKDRQDGDGIASALQNHPEVVPPPNGEAPNHQWGNSRSLGGQPSSLGWYELETYSSVLHIHVGLRIQSPFCLDDSKHMWLWDTNQVQVFWSLQGLKVRIWFHSSSKGWYWSVQVDSSMGFKLRGQNVPTWRRLGDRLTLIRI